MHVGVHRRSANIHAYIALNEGLERLFLSSERIVKMQLMLFVEGAHGLKFGF